MRKLIAAINKEILLLIRDLPGLAILFVMPVLLILVVTLAQEKAMKSQVGKALILLIDHSKSELSGEIRSNIQQSGFFTLVDASQDTISTLESQKMLIANGKYSLGLILYPGDSSMHIWVDPALQSTYTKGLVQSLTYLIRAAQSKESLEEMLMIISGNNKQVAREIMKSALENLPEISESYAMSSKSKINPTPIQNNVPGFILFAMFFIVIPLSGSLINEKNEGSSQRLGTLPVSFLTLLLAKVIVFLAVCLTQFLMMILVGLWVFPAFFDLPALDIGNHYAGILIATICASLAAIGFGIIVGSLSTTHNQAAMFGSVMVVLLGTISGTFLPIHIMPEAIRWISHLSPIRWGIDNYLTLFIRDGSIPDIILNSILLLSFFGLAMMISIVIFAKRK